MVGATTPTTMRVGPSLHTYVMVAVVAAIMTMVVEGGGLIDGRGRDDGG